MTSSPARIDIEKIIRRAKLRSAREPAPALTIMLFQAIHAIDPSSKIEFRMMIDEGRNVHEQIFAIRQAGQLWTIKGQGDWDWQMQRALSSNVQTWKNPKLMPLHEKEHDALSEQALLMDFPLSPKVRTRINEAASWVQARRIAEQSPLAPANRKAPRL